MKNLFCRVGLLGSIGLLAAAAQAQTQPALVRPDTTTRVNQVPPLSKKEKAKVDSTKLTERLFGMRLTRPGKAALLAAIAPGAGQIYNERWWKLPLVYGALGGVVAGEVFYQERYREYSDAYNLLLKPNSNVQIGSPDLGKRAREERSAEAINSGIVFYRGYRDLFILYIGLAYGAQILDAVVDAHLKDFDVSDDLSLHWEPTLLPVPGRALALPTAPGVSFALRMK